MTFSREGIVELLGSLPAGALGTDKPAIRALARSPAHARGADPAAPARVCQSREAGLILFAAEANASEGGGAAPPAAALLPRAAVARLMAEAAGAVRPTDFSDASMRDMLLAAIKPGAKPFAGDRAAEWGDFVVMQCRLNMALRV